MLNRLNILASPSPTHPSSSSSPLSSHQSSRASSPASSVSSSHQQQQQQQQQQQPLQPRTSMYASRPASRQQHALLAKPTAGSGAPISSSVGISSSSSSSPSPSPSLSAANTTAIRKAIPTGIPAKSALPSPAEKHYQQQQQLSTGLTPSHATSVDHRPISPSPHNSSVSGGGGEGGTGASGGAGAGAGAGAAASTVPSSSSSSTVNPTSKTENVTVTVRIRPFSSSELKVAGGPTDVWAVSDDAARIGYADDFAVHARRAAVEYAYDHALTGSDNEEIYNSSVKNLVQSAMEGYNGTVFAYGQTSSGKTYSGNETQPGITPRAVEDIFKYIRENPDREFLLRVSYLEIYNESIRDLLSPEAIDLRIHEDKRRGVYVSPLKEEIVTTPSQVIRIIERGDYQRHVSSTDFNAHSSRSHSIFQIVIESRDRSPGTGSPTMRKHAGSKSASAVRVSQLNLIDLAGSEKAASNEERRKEGAFINKSLLTLGTVISKLTEEKGAHIPYRDSKLTRILQSSLNGNARVSVICTISPSSLNVEESHNTLKFAARVKKVVTKAQTNSVMDDKALLEKYRREISELKAQLMLTATNGGSDGAAAGGAGAGSGGKQAELSTLLEKERLKHEEEMVEMNMVRNALKERIDHLTKLILTSQSINTKATTPEQPAGRYTVETSADGTVLEFPKEIESRLAHKDAMVKQLQSELEAQQEKMVLMKTALEKTVKGENVDLERTLAKVMEDKPREKLLNEKRASIVNVHSLEDGTNHADIAALIALQGGDHGHGTFASSDTDKSGSSIRRVDSSKDDTRSLLGIHDEEDEVVEDEDDLLDTPWNREELHSLRQAKRELEIIVIEQEKKLEDMVAFEDSDEFRNLVIELEEQRERNLVLKEEREGLRAAVGELQNKIRSMEMRESTPPVSSLSSSSTSFSGGGMMAQSSATARAAHSESLASAAARIKELENVAQKERRLRMEEQSRNMGRIASLEAELTMMKAELSVHNLAAYS
ncbi:hypothetical protein EDD11_004204 [Mortierella claussenii]|nr:hypothetical protein EDD11_004204 [Mortierella claussenii]